MKKFLIATNVLLLGLIAFQACNSNIRTGLNTDPCMARLCKPYSDGDLGGKIDVKAIREMSLAYSADAGKNFIMPTCDVVNPNTNYNTARTGGRQDALSIVFDIEKLKNLIYQMEKNACDHKCDTSIKLGIRYYFIKYPCDLGLTRFKGDGLDGLSSKEINNHSLVMVPVYKVKKGEDWYDYNLWDVSGKCFPRIDTIYHRDDFGLFKGILPDAGDNHGGIGPPPDPGTFPTNPPGQ
jgi:hypothetical protein